MVENTAAQDLKEAREDGNVSFDKVFAAQGEFIPPTDDDMRGELPCGLIYEDKEGVVHVYKNFVIRDTDGSDEEALAPFLRKGRTAKIPNRLLERAVMQIGDLKKSKMGTEEWREKVIEKLCVPDQDYLMLKIRKVSSADEEIESEHTCPECGAHIRHFFLLDELEENQYEGDDTHTRVFMLPRGVEERNKKGEVVAVHKEVRMRLLDGKDREVCMPAVQQNPGKATTIALSRICEFTDGFPLNEHTLRDMKTIDRKCLEKNNREMIDFGVKMEVEVECQECGKVFKDSVSGIGNFF